MSDPVGDPMLRALNEALYQAFFADEAANKRWEKIQGELDEPTRGALMFGIISMKPAPAAALERLRRRIETGNWTDELP